MSRIEQLIAELCPDGVEWKELGEVCKILGRIGFRGYSRSDIVPYNEGAISLSPSNITNNQVNYEKCTFISWEKYQQSPEIKVEKGDIIFCKTASVGKTALIKHLPEATTINPQLALLKEIKCDNSYLSYLLISDDFQKQVNTIKGVGSIPTISQKALSTLSIPIPPLPIQQEIVRILDTFTDLDAELQAELEARKKQYEHYRNQLLNFEGKEVEWKTLGEVCKYIVSGGTPSTNRSEYYGGDIPWLRTQEIDWNDIYDTGIKISELGLNNSSAKWIKPNCVIVAMYGATAAKVAVNKIPLTTNQACCNLEINDAIANYRFVYHWICKEYENLKSLGEGVQSNINSQKIRRYNIPIPPLPEQERIVSILDKFEALVNDELPAEIAARRKQYEYYREKLLTFEPLIS